MSDELLSEGAKHVAEHGATSLGSVVSLLGLQYFLGRKSDKAEEAEAKAKEAEAKAKEAAADALEKRLGALEAGQAKVLELLGTLVAREERVKDDREELRQLRRDHDGLRAEVAALRAVIETRRESEGA